jgi:aminoglycoside phosphotransferase (APT) family kinase protein
VPDLAAQLRAHWADLAGLATTTFPLPVRLSHGDYTLSQVVFDGSGVGLLDFDRVCRAEPALDLGEFCAYLRVKCRKADRHVNRGGGRLADELCELFLATYDASVGAGESDARRTRARLYEAYFLLRIAARSWQQIKVSRALIALSVLEERLAWGTPSKA